jgi:hypothetical protein
MMFLRCMEPQSPFLHFKERTLMKILTLLAALLSLSACATCERHPYVCATAGAIVVGSIAYTLEMHSDRHNSAAAPIATRPSFCGPTGASCQ